MEAENMVKEQRKKFRNKEKRAEITQEQLMKKARLDVDNGIQETLEEKRKEYFLDELNAEENLK